MKKLINLLLIALFAISCTVTKPQAERRIAKYVEMYPDLIQTKHDTIHLPGDTIELIFTENLFDSEAADSILAWTIDSLGVEINDEVRKAIANTTRKIEKRTYDNIRSQLKPYTDSASGISINFNLDDFGRLGINVKIPPKDLPIETQVVTVAPLTWFQKNWLYLVLGAFVLGLTVTTLFKKQ